MKIKRHIIWRRVKYGNNRFKFWSCKITGKGDKTLLKDSLFPRDWKKVIVFRPTGDPETTFSMGSSIAGITKVKVSDIVRMIKKGPFGMRLRPYDCEFFVASNVGKVGLEFVKYADIADETEPELFVY